MSSIITSLLSSTVGLLWNKARDLTAAKLKDGDVTDAKMREIVVRELNDVKRKLDGLSRKDILSSYRFLKEGVDFLNVCMNKAKLEQKGNLGPLSLDVHQSKSEPPSGGHFEVLNESLELPHVMGKLKIYSGTEFESAIKRFEDARKKATDAFCNEALNIKDRIFAAKLRIVSEILECLDSPETAITGCLSFLQDLHSLPAIRETFLVYLKGGVKSWVGKAEREENVKSIMMINYVLFELNQKFSRQITDRVTWPGAGIELPGRSFNPISDWQEVSTSKSMPRELSHPANEIIFDEQIHPRCLTINSRGDVVTNGEWRGNNILVFSKKCRKVANLPAAVGEGEAILRQNIIALAVDDKDNVYIARCLEIRNVLRGESDCSYELIVLTGCFDVHHACTLEFLKTTNRLFVTGMAINKYNHIIFLKSNVCKVYVVETTGELLYTFTPDLQVWPTCLGISNRNEIMISTPRDMASIDDVKVHFYSEEGNLNSTIELPEGYKVLGMTFHFIVRKLIILSLHEEKDTCFLLSYNEACELESTTFFCTAPAPGYDLYGNPLYASYIASHPSGLAVVLGNTTATFI